jgi:hypothetical protein
MIVEGTYTMKLVGSLKEVSAQCYDYKGLGWRVRDVYRQRHWPCFWRVIYTVYIVKDVIVDDKHIIETPIKDLL